jgi:HSP20 family protein
MVARGSAIQRLEIPYGRFMRRISLSAARLELERTDLVRGCLSLRLIKQL